MGSQTSVASVLLAAGASVDLCTADGTLRSPLFVAAVAGSVSTVSMLLAAGALVDARDSYGATPLLQVCQSATPESDALVVELLLAAGAHAGCSERQGNTPLIAACRSGFVKGVRALLVHGGMTAVHSRLPDGTTALIAAAEAGMADVVTMLLRAGALADHQRWAYACHPWLLLSRHLARSSADILLFV
jgi:ankyrin repeat protein